MREARLFEAHQLGIVMSMDSFVRRPACLVSLLFALASCASNQVGSMGAHLSRDNDTGALYVRDVFPGLGAARAGLDAGDEIVMIEGRYVRELGAARVRELLRGDVDTAVRLTVVRGKLVMRVRLVRTPLRDPKQEEPKPRMETMAE